VRHSTIKLLSLARLTYASSDHKHVTLKIGTPEALEGELRVLKLLRTIKTSHSGSLLVRQMLDDFQVHSKNDVFQCVVHPPLAISIKAFRRMLPNRALPVSLVKPVLKHLLLGLDFLHTEAKVIHTGESSRIQRS
jgi:serine/threonine-protein kinase SRPK3